jgi:hypothetical protein
LELSDQVSHSKFLSEEKESIMDIQSQARNLTPKSELPTILILLGLKEKVEKDINKKVADVQEIEETLNKIKKDYD